MNGQMTIFDYCENRQSDLEKRYQIPRLSKDILSEEGWCDDWHYCEIEEPDEAGVYFTISEHGEYYHYNYRAWAVNQWWWWDSWCHKFRPETDRQPFAWVRIPSKYLRVDKSLKERLGMEGIIGYGENKDI